MENKPLLPIFLCLFPKGKITALVGPNGCGKSTLLKTLVGINKAKSGEVLLEGKTLSSYSDKALARSLSLLPQILVNPEGITVRKLVEYGRSPYVSHWEGWLKVIKILLTKLCVILVCWNLPINR